MLKVTLIGGNIAEVTKTLFRAASKAAIEDAVVAWHERYAPIHFTEEGFDRYNYRPRKGQNEPRLIYSNNPLMRQARMTSRGRLINNPKYFWQKVRRMKTRDPLVWSGDSRRQALASIRVDSKITSDGAEIQGIGTMDLPPYFYKYQKNDTPIDKVDELTRTTADEDAELTTIYNAALGAHLAAAAAPSPSVLRIA